MQHSNPLNRLTDSSGLAVVTKTNVNDGEPIAKYVPGQYFGEQALVRQPRDSLSLSVYLL